MKNKMLIGTDYDGTLRRGTPDVIPTDREAIKKWREDGNIFGIVTGRNIASIESEIKALKLDYDYIAADNGGNIFAADGTRLFSKEVDGKYLKKLVQFIYDNGGLGCGVDHGIVHEDVFNRERGMQIPDGSFFDKIKNFVQVNTYFREVCEAQSLAAKVNKEFDGIVNAFVNGVCVDIPAFGISKATGVKAAADVFGVKYDDCITIGDNYNDIEMLEAFTSAAVSTTTDEIKRHATTTVNDFAELTEFFTNLRNK